MKPKRFAGLRADIQLELSNLERLIEGTRELPSDAPVNILIVCGAGIIITRDGWPVAVLHGVTDDTLEDYLFETDPRLIARIQEARAQYRIEVADSAALYAEFADENVALAEIGLEDYAASLDEEDGHDASG